MQAVQQIVQQPENNLYPRVYSFHEYEILPVA